MLKKVIHEILDRSEPHGWVLEPEAKRILSLSGIDVPDSCWARSAEEAVQFADASGYPVVAKIVSPDVIHKSEAGGVAVGLESPRQVRSAFQRFARRKGFNGMLVEEMIGGLELIVGGKIDEQFGPVVLLGMGGTGVEIYRDTALRMAPIKEKDVVSMVNCLTAGSLLHGFRGEAAVDMQSLIELMLSFSSLLMKMAGRIESADLNPVMCTSSACKVADARIILAAQPQRP
jgi:succinyl-CoA synthetase beta subunit